MAAADCPRPPWEAASSSKSGADSATSARIRTRSAQVRSFRERVRRARCTEGPATGDQVVEEGGARVFLEAAAAAVLEDKALDAQVNEQGDLAFRISDRARPA
jgi:Fe-S cluster assembly iron-binding protein IscA